jgi:hypothetical protein
MSLEGALIGMLTLALGAAFGVGGIYGIRSIRSELKQEKAVQLGLSEGEESREHLDVAVSVAEEKADQAMERADEAEATCRALAEALLRDGKK